MNSQATTTPQVVLASSSPYRKMLLQRLQLRFDCASPNIDETPEPGETARQTSARLAEAKARAIQRTHPDALIIASDQVCLLDQQQLGKPGTLARARQQLHQLSGRSAHFHTAVCVACGDELWLGEDCTEVRFRLLDEGSIERYLAQEPALDCAGSFMSEGLGISLCEAIHSSDPTALIGLPLIMTAQLLRGAGLRLP